MSTMIGDPAFAQAIAERNWAVELPWVVHWLDQRAEPPSSKPEQRRFASRDEATAFGSGLAGPWSVWMEQRVEVYRPDA